MTTLTTSLRPVTGALGAEVIGVDLARLSPEGWGQIHALWLDYQVLFFPEQQVGPDAHVALGRLFGEPEIHPFIPKLDDAHPEIAVLDGIKTDVWHTDVTFSATPPIASVLHMVTCPSRGGDTVWTNQYLAYETLSPAYQDLLSGLTAVHTASPMGHPEIAATHPVVRIHPETGRESLYVNRGFTSHFVELGRAESDALLAFLFSWSEQPRFQCRYRWSERAVGIWDNRCTQHYGVNDYSERRVIHRVTVLGDRPEGRPARWSPVGEEVRGEVVAQADPRSNPGA